MNGPAHRRPALRLSDAKAGALLAVLLLLVGSEAAAQRTVLHAGRLLDVRSGTMIRDARETGSQRHAEAPGTKRRPAAAATSADAPAEEPSAAPEELAED